MNILIFVRLFLFVTFVVNSANSFSDESTRPFRRLINSGDVVGRISLDCTLPTEGLATVSIPGLSIISKAEIGEQFRLLNVPKGTYDVVIEPPQIVSPIAKPLLPKTIENVVVNKRKVTDLGDIELCDNQCTDNSECGFDSYCQKETGNCGGVGVCQQKGDLCPQVFDPVCGCDGNTYSNSCLAGVAGVSVAHEGECDGEVFCPAVWMPVCGVDGKTYGNACEANKTGVKIAHKGACEDKVVCPQVWQPVCGVNNKTYSNKCEANAAGVQVKYTGECETKRPVCGGIAGLQCPGSMICIDNPGDSCDPEQGGRDCSGICVLPER
jgi:hypothetical protein